VARFDPIAFRRSTLDWSRTYVCAVINVTPDSFSDGGEHASVDSAVAFALRSIASGADLVDIGGESTRPGARPVSEGEEVARVLPVIRGLVEAGAGAPICIDTTKAGVARAALEAGAEVVNDISGGRFDPAIVDVAAAAGAAYVCGHVRGATLAQAHAAEAAPPTVAEIACGLAERVAALPPELARRTLIDPGIGFGKSGAINLALLAGAGALSSTVGRPVLVGPSRKRFLGELCGKPARQRDDATIGACLAAVAGGAHVLRVHEAGRMRDALTAFEAVRRRVS
jgi:dihydropteroate synthase